jgi:hypothetical protein
MVPVSHSSQVGLNNAHPRFRWIRMQRTPVVRFQYLPRPLLRYPHESRPSKTVSDASYCSDSQKVRSRPDATAPRS